MKFFAFLFVYIFFVPVLLYGSTQKELVITGDKNYAPYSYLDASGKPQGLLIDLWKEWALVNDTKIRFKLVDWLKSVDSLQKKKVDIHSGVYESIENTFALYPIHRTEVSLFSHKDYNKILSNQKVGVIDPTFGDTLKKDYPKIELVVYENYDLLFNAMATKKIEFFFDSKYPAQYAATTTELDSLIVFVSQIEHLVHAIQKERGISSGHISSHSVMFQEELKKVREETDREKTKLLNILESKSKLLSKYFTQKDKELLHTSLSTLETLREEVQTLGIDFKNLYFQYSQIITLLLLNISDTSSKLEHEALKNYLYTYSTFLMYKESLGQKRAILTNLFAKKDSSIHHREHFLTASIQEKVYLKTFLHSSDEDINRFLQDILDTPLVKNVQRYEKLAQDKLDGVFVDVDTKACFKEYSKKIDLITQVERLLYTKILLKSDEVKRKNTSLAKEILFKTSPLEKEYLFTMTPLVHNKSLAEHINGSLETISSERLKEIEQKWNVDSYYRYSLLTAEENNWVKKNVVRIGVEQWNPVIFSNDGTDINGIAGDFTKKIIENTGLNVEIVSDKWNVLLKDFEDKKLDVLPATYLTHKRTELGLYGDGYFKMRDAIYMKDSLNEVKLLKDLEGKKLAIPKGYGTVEKIQNRFPKIKLIFTNDLSDSIHRVLNGEVDALYEGQIVAEAKIQDELIKGLKSIPVREFKAPSLHYFSAIDKPLLHSILAKGLKSISYSEKTAIISKWSSLKKELLLSSKEQKYLDKAKPIKYVFDPLWKPFEWKDSLDQHQGIILDILKLVQVKSGLNFESVESSTWNEALLHVKSNKASMFSGLGFTKERQKNLQFTTNSLLETPYVFISQSGGKYMNGFDDLKNKRVILVENFAIEDLIKENRKDLHYTTVSSVTEGLDRLTDKKSDVLIVSGIVAKYYMNSFDYDDLKIAYKTDYSLDLKIALRKDMPLEALSIIDKSLELITQKEYDDIIFKWTQHSAPSESNWMLISQIAGVMLVVVLLISINNYQLKRKVEEKTKELSHLLKDFDANIIASKTDLKGRITHVSKAFCEISQYSKEELLGEAHNIIRHPDMPKEAFEDVWKTIRSGKEWRGEVKNMKKDGTYYWVHATIFPEYDKQGKIISYGAIRHDITAQKEVEELTQNLEVKIQERTKELDEERKFHKILLDSQEQIIITTDGTNLKSANETFFDFFAVDTIEDFMQEYDASCICETFNTNAPDGYLQTKMGRETWVEYVVSRSFNHIHKAMISMGSMDFVFSVTATKLPGKHDLKSAVFTNITEMEKAKRETEDILANILLPVLITNKKDRKITYANRYAEKQYKLPLQEIIGKGIDSIYTIDGQHHHIVKTIEKDGYIENSEEEFLMANGDKFTALLSVIPITYKGEASYIGMVADITQQKLREKEIAAIHKHTKESIEYAGLIQSALIPDKQAMKKYFKDQFIIWKPKDTVGGDIYLFEELRNEDECLLMVIDCTGHGVPGAFVTMLVKAIERQVTAKINHSNNTKVSPAEILSVFNKSMKQLLKQESKDSISNAGFDGQIVYYNKKEKIIKTASARNEIFYYQNDILHVIKGDRHSVGYKDSNAHYEFSEHILDVSSPTTFYVATDGFWDQNGGEKSLPYGKRRFKKMLEEIHSKNMNEQKNEFLSSFNTYKNDEEINDDVTVVGFKV